jgi:hypothetical protein
MKRNDDTSNEQWYGEDTGQYVRVVLVRHAVL